ncbi:hypothetical protein GCM10011505_50580 [Tistrella bauzanensis]|uniref:Uncharacterized protein n=1 Tax=Tistrella bauzanensis TaxID=657419 RepID=A0ABQ1JDQ9_9PROT|nr:hypothetical protein [Tistrella bauzanensis]GGB63919.1 hypothetical protein GCM10011505_50580 [Tistrella bauzanensis]
MFVSAFLREMRGRLRARLWVTPITQLPAMGAKPGAQGALLGRQMPRRLRLADAELRYRLARAGFSDISRLLDRAFQVLAKGAFQNNHNSRYPISAAMVENMISACGHRARTLAGDILFRRSLAWRIFWYSPF